MTLRNHILELDGVRGVAILLVLATHFTPDSVLPSRPLEWLRKACDSGWVGVDLFFVLSGFLITGILLRTKGKPHALKVFFARRILRIFPLYLAALLAVFVVLPQVRRVSGDPLNAGFQALLHLQTWAWLHCTNIGMYVAWPTAAATDASVRPFQSSVVSISHFWSLSVEEHFYLVWPFVVFGLNSQRLKSLCLGILCFSLSIRLVGVALHQNPYFFLLTPCRIDALAIGSYLAAFTQDRPISDLYPAALITGSVSGASLSVFFFAAHGLWAWSPWIQGPGLTLVELSFGSLLVIVLSGSATSVLRRCCRNSLLRFFGKYSYGIYVIHGLLMDQLSEHRVRILWYVFPFEAAAAMIGSAFFAMLAIILVKTLVSVAAALVSWHVLESPALRLKKYFEVEPDIDARRSAAYVR